MRQVEHLENKLTLYLLRVFGLELVSARLRAGAKLRALSQDDASGDLLPVRLTAEITSNRIILTLLFHKHKLCCLNGHDYLPALSLAVEESTSCCCACSANVVKFVYKGQKVWRLWTHQSWFTPSVKFIKQANFSSWAPNMFCHTLGVYSWELKQKIFKK